MNPTFEEIRRKLTILTNEVSDLSDAVVDKGGSQETHLPAIASEISNLWTGGDGIVWTKIDANYNPISIEFRCSTYNSIIPAPQSTKHIRIKPTPFLVSNGLTIVSSVFSNSQLESIELFDSYQTTIGEGAFYKCEHLRDVKLGNTTSISPAAFSNSGLESIDLSNVTTLGYYCFGDCANLKSVTLGTSMTSLPGKCFYSSGLTSIDLSNITTIGSNCFENCADLKSVVLNTSTTNIPDYCFRDCVSLTSIDLSHVQYLGYYAFYNCKSLKTVDLSGIVSLSNNLIFFGCENLETVTMNPSITSIPYYCFNGCTNLKNIDLSNVKSISDSAFEKTGMTNVVLNDVTSISSSAFAWSSLNSITIKSSNPSSISISSSAFNYTDHLTDIYVSWSEGEVWGAPWGATNATIHYNTT